MNSVVQLPLFKEEKGNGETEGALLRLLTRIQPMWIITYNKLTKLSRCDRTTIALAKYSNNIVV